MHRQGHQETESRRIKTQIPLSVILEGSGSGSTENANLDELNSTLDTKGLHQKVSEWEAQNEKYRRSQSKLRNGKSSHLVELGNIDISDSEFCSSEQGINKIAQDEAERLLFLNSGTGSFFDKSGIDKVDGDNTAARTNKTPNFAEMSMGAYFQLRSSHPMKERGLDTSRIQKTLDTTGLGWLETSDIANPEPSNTSTPKPKPDSSGSGHGKVKSVTTFTSTSILQEGQSFHRLHHRSDVNGNPRTSTMMSTSMSTSMVRLDQSVVQVLHETNGSICSLAKFFNGPEGREMGKDSMLAHVLNYCKTQSERGSSPPPSLPDISRYSGFEENLQPDSESSATSTSRNTSSNRGSPNHTILAVSRTSPTPPIEKQPESKTLRPSKSKSAKTKSSQPGRPEILEERPTRIQVKDSQRIQIKKKETKKVELHLQSTNQPQCDVAKNVANTATMSSSSVSSTPAMSAATAQMPMPMSSMFPYPYPSSWPWPWPMPPQNHSNEIVPPPNCPSSIPMFGYPHPQVPIVIQIQCPCHNNGNSENQQQQAWKVVQSAASGNSCSMCSSCSCGGRGQAQGSLTQVQNQ